MNFTRGLYLIVRKSSQLFQKITENICDDLMSRIIWMKAVREISFSVFSFIRTYRNELIKIAHRNGELSAGVIYDANVAVKG